MTSDANQTEPNGGTEPEESARPTEARWTHVALRVKNIEATIAWYTEFTPLALIDRRTDDDGYGAWLAMPEKTNNPFLLVVAEFFPETDPYDGLPPTVLAPFAHLGIELPTKDDVDKVAEKGQKAGCLAVRPVQLPPPIGYITMLKDPDGNTVEFSWDQGVYSALQTWWKQNPESAGTRGSS